MSKIVETSKTRYNLCRATRARVASLPPSPMAQPGAGTIDITPLSKLTPVGSRNTTPVEKPETSAVRKYSDVVRAGSRSNSLAPECATVDIYGSRMTSPVYPGAFEFPEATKVYPVGARVPAHSIVDSLGNVESNTPSPRIMSEAEVELEDQRPWTTVVRKKSREKRNAERLRPEQERAIKEAEKCLTLEERERIGRRLLSVQRESQHDGSSDSETYQKGRKGKGPDPRNWGGLGLSDGELDLDTQHAAYASWKTANRLARGSESEGPGPSQKRDTKNGMTVTDDERQDSDYAPVKKST
ncbi:hypothetical protein M404DRAFT_27491 [Pisolithus tinctorius Marx 270]|uniref:Uncharacterized protein n=1 Tax=Pisolithus tinctorius Marx 270 TaxID=870435 RepID=A0A0C3J1F4_PISTI|nr:hypothetical protein M404DRAFT_27491 [Pisolithus tinctorius Marx 270]